MKTYDFIIIVNLCIIKSFILSFLLNSKRFLIQKTNHIYNLIFINKNRKVNKK